MVDLSYKFQLPIVNRLKGDSRSNDVNPLEDPRQGLEPEMYLVDLFNILYTEPI